MHSTHECPLCGKEVQSKINMSNRYQDKYLDGQHKMPFDVFMSMYHMCPRCGLVYVFYGTGTLFVSDATKNISLSDEYQNIFRDKTLSEPLKMLKLIKELSKAHEIMGQDINWLFLRYFEELDDQKNIDKYLKKVIKDIEGGLFFHTNLYTGETCCNLGGKLILNPNIVFVDLYRRLGQFEKAKEYINICLQYKWAQNNTALKQYLAIQEKLIEKQFRRHI